MGNWSKLAPYWFLLFTIGFGWFILSPLVPILGKVFGVNLTSIILLISAYGYTMVVLGLLAGYISAKFTVKAALYSAAIISVIGLIGRAISPNYISFLITGIIAAIAYPLAMAPVGTVADSIFKDKSHTVIGISVGLLFLGMAFGAFLGPGIFTAIGLSGALWTTVVLAIIAAIWIGFGIKGYPTFYKGKSLKGSFKPGMIKNWYVGLSISAISVMFGGIASTVLLLHKFSVVSALSYGGLMGGLAFLGSALGAIILPPLFEKYKQFRLGLVSTGVLMFLATILMVLGLSYTSAIAAIAAGFFLFGFFGNAYWSMAMTSTTNYVSDPAQAGFATSMYSVFTNLGVAFVPVILGGYFASFATIAIGVTAVLVLEFISMVLSPMLLVRKAVAKVSSSARGRKRKR
ncbi:MAG: MFS transporter [Candidatus Micrarchaeum sp. ARMAN-1]|nr:MAG: MFS transporter [Candidatus Micrarchaeum sp. ARMAN-1]